MTAPIPTPATPRPTTSTPATTPETAQHDRRLLTTARALESQFLAEMLKHAGLGEARESFGGGIGEEQFASFLRQAQADAIADAGGIGLAQHIFEALKERSNDQG